jgi:hypothetical protein
MIKTYSLLAAELCNHLLLFVKTWRLRGMLIHRPDKCYWRFFYRISMSDTLDTNIPMR